MGIPVAGGFVGALMLGFSWTGAADAQEADYTGWQIIVTGIETTTAKYRSDLGYRVTDECTIVKRGNSRYVINEDPQGEGLQRFSAERVSAITHLRVSGQGSAYFYDADPPLTQRWSYRLGPSPYPEEMESFAPGSGGAPQLRPDEPLFMPRRIDVSSYVPEAEWEVTPEEHSSLAGAKDLAIKAWEASEEGDPGPLEFVFPHRLDGEHLTASASRSFTFNLHDLLPIDEVQGICSIEVTYNVTVVPATGDSPTPRAELEEIDRSWWPEENNSLTARVFVRGDEPAQAFRFTLQDVSTEPGVCGNSVDQNADPDLAFEPDAGDWSVEKAGDGWVATSNEGGMEATVKIACRDWGAWGKLRAEAMIDDRWEPAQVSGGLDYARIPFDDDDDHVADSWQAAHDVGGMAARDDRGKEPVNPGNDGDGLSVYECYRGFVVLTDTGEEHVSPDPRQKVLFVLDKSGLFDPGVWERCSGIKAYLLDATMSQPGPTPPDGARLVNFRSSYAKNGGKYCVVVTPVEGFYKDSDGDIPMGVANGPGGGCPTSPRDVESLYIYPGNALAWINTFATRLGIAAAQPDSKEAKEFDKLGLPRAMWKRASDKLSEGYRLQLADQTMRHTVIHEMGHCCGLMGHYRKGDPSMKEEPIGDKNCPMCYSEYSDGLEYIILQVLMKPDAAMPMAYDRFCSDGDFDCWGHLNVKDN